jgi:hypothetical protein
MNDFLRYLQNKNSSKFKNLVWKTIKDKNYQDQINKHIDNINNNSISKSIMCTFRMSRVQIKL